MKRLPLFILAWVLYAALTLPLTVLGVPLVLIYALLPNTTGRRESQHYKDKRAVLVWSNRTINEIWGNDEDGIDGLPWVNLTDPQKTVQPRQIWWANKTRGKPQWLRIFLWSALRNSTANLRFTWLGLLIDPTQVAFIQTARYSLTWQGYKAAFRWNYSAKHSFWIGWKVKPQDKQFPGHLLPDTETRAPGAGFAFQPFAGV